MPRRSHLVLVAALALIAPLTVSLGGSVAQAEESEGPAIEVGTELVAVNDVTLHKAEIAKGSRVSVTKVLTAAGRVESVSVALADGHVVKVSPATLASHFRVAR